MRISDWSSDVCSSDLWCFDLSWPAMQWLAGSRFALWWLPEARWFALPLALLGAFWCLLPRGVPGKALALLLWLPLLWPSRGLPGQGEAELVVLDVGQGLSVLVRTARHGLLYDMRSEEHTSELQSPMRISYAVFCLKKKKKTNNFNSSI